MAMYLIERVARDLDGRISRVRWYQFEPVRRPPVVCDVRNIVEAIRGGHTAKVVCGGLIGHPLVPSPDGQTIVDASDAEVLALALVPDLDSDVL